MTKQQKITEWQAGFNAGAFNALEDVAKFCVERIFCDYTTPAERRLYLRTLHRLEEFMPEGSMP